MRPLVAAGLLAGGIVFAALPADAQTRVCVADDQGRIVCGEPVDPQGTPQYRDAPQAAPQPDEDDDIDGSGEAYVAPPYDVGRGYAPAPGYGYGYGRYAAPYPPMRRHWHGEQYGYAAPREWYPIGPRGECPYNYTIQHGRCEPYRGR